MFEETVESGDGSEAERVRGIESVYFGRNYVDFAFGGRGLGSGTGYYGVFYSADGNMKRLYCGGGFSDDGFAPSGSGRPYEESGGDNRYYAEALGGGFYYYEMSY